MAHTTLYAVVMAFWRLLNPRRSNDTLGIFGIFYRLEHDTLSILALCMLFVAKFKGA